MAKSKIVLARSGQSLNALIHEHFALSGAGSRRLTAEAIRAISEANPHLSDVNSLSEGTPILIPDLPHLTPAPAAPSAAGHPAAVHDMLEQATGALRSVRGSLSESHQSAVREARETLEVLRSREFKRAATDPAAADRIASMTASANASIRDAEALARSYDAGLDELLADLREFTSKVGRVRLLQ